MKLMTVAHEKIVEAQVAIDKSLGILAGLKVFTGLGEQETIDSIQTTKTLVETAIKLGSNSVRGLREGGAIEVEDLRLKIVRTERLKPTCGLLFVSAIVSFSALPPQIAGVAGAEKALIRLQVKLEEHIKLREKKIKEAKEKLAREKEAKESKEAAEKILQAEKARRCHQPIRPPGGASLTRCYSRAGAERAGG